MLALDNNFRLYIELKVFVEDNEELASFVNTSYVAVTAASAFARAYTLFSGV